MDSQNNVSDEYKPKWRHFHSQSTVWIQNILSHDVVYQVADEHNNAYQYRLPAGSVSELPGGPVATLGVKAIVDELIQNNPSEVLRIYEPSIREKYEKDVILRVKESPIKEAKGPHGEINLGIDTNEAPAEEEEEAFDIPEVTVVAEQEEEVAFPAIKQKVETKSKTSDKGSAVADKVAAGTKSKLAPAQIIEA